MQNADFVSLWLCVSLRTDSQETKNSEEILRPRMPELRLSLPMIDTALGKIARDCALIVPVSGISERASEVIGSGISII